MVCTFKKSNVVIEIGEQNLAFSIEVCTLLYQQLMTHALQGRIQDFMLGVGVVL